ncbi:DUF3841 domain-containing protein [Deinococcus cellulosilyticus]|uniref:DUF3841 domain-containing protein n=1 Tax=Deinococcus cellulosilyticus (strain DSM 18568 / NBRC 106333 / KACC 11606 / 5516J-15) TaxID=1223518 RepID=A0A511N6B1_DEIC1|nr:DUF3841 domain-containing protein [Deinococcus cellulosilyticus]GEM48385.1 hypothetical protein DC3_40200 [Deinococcus cellulosilyticus NBRC 106333 = KACC 11606]
MKVWSHQTIEAFEVLQKHGVLRGERKYVDQDFVHAYDVLRDMMHERLGPPPSPDSYPIWVWVRGRSGKRYGGRKPTSRYKGHVLLTLEVPEERILVSDFHAWHSCLNSRALCVFESEEDNHYETLIADLPQFDARRTSLIRDTWWRITDLSWCLRHVYESENPKTMWLQGTLWEIRQRDVVKVEHLQYARETWEKHLTTRAY